LVWKNFLFVILPRPAKPIAKQKAAANHFARGPNKKAFRKWEGPLII
jgi:hypothetical protein